MGQGCPSLSTSSGSSSGTDPVSQKRRVVRQQDGGGSRQQLSSCDAAQGPEVVESFEEALRTKLSQGNKAMTQVKQGKGWQLHYEMQDIRPCI